MIASPFIVLWLFNSFGIIGVILTVSDFYVAATAVYAFARVDTSPQAIAHIAPAGDIAEAL